MDFPADPPDRCEPPDVLLEGLDLPRTASTWQGREDFLVLLEDEQAAGNLQPDHRRLRHLHGRGVIVTGSGR